MRHFPSMSNGFWSNEITKNIYHSMKNNRTFIFKGRKKSPLPLYPNSTYDFNRWKLSVLHLTIEPENYQLLRLFLTLVFFIEKKVKLYEMELKYRENGSWEKSSVLFFQMSGPSSSPDSPYLDWGNAFSLFSGGVPCYDSASVLERIL